MVNPKASIAGLAALGTLTLAGLIGAQEDRIVSVKRAGFLTWTESWTNGECGCQSGTEFLHRWVSAPVPCGNSGRTRGVISVAVATEESQARTPFLPPASSTNAAPRGDAYDVDARGIPQFVEVDYIELGKIARISRFRSGEGHDYSDDFERCRSMKHYFEPVRSEDWARVQIRSPVVGMVDGLEREWAGTQVRIRSREFPAFCFLLFHVRLSQPLAIGDAVAAGQLVGTHVGSETASDIAVGVNTPKGWKLVSYFEVMADTLFDRYKSRGLNARSDAIISQAARDNEPLSCTGATFRNPGSLTNWVTLR